MHRIGYIICLANTVMNLCSVPTEISATVLTGEFTNGSIPLTVVSPDKMDSLALIVTKLMQPNTSK